MAEGGHQVPGRPSYSRKCNLCLSKNTQRNAVIFCTLCDEAHCKKCFTEHSVSGRALKTSDNISSYRSLQMHNFNDVRAKFQNAFRSLGKKSVVKDKISNQVHDNKPANSDVVNDEFGIIVSPSDNLNSNLEEVHDGKPANSDVVNDEHGMIVCPSDNQDNNIEEEIKTIRNNVTDDMEGNKRDLIGKSIESHLSADTQVIEHAVNKKPIDASSSSRGLCDETIGSSFAEDQLVGKRDVGERSDANRMVVVKQVYKDLEDDEQANHQVVRKKQSNRGVIYNTQTNRNVICDKPRSDEADTKQDDSKLIDDQSLKRNVKKNKKVTNCEANDESVGKRVEEEWLTESLVEDGKKVCMRVAGDKPIDGDLTGEKEVEFDMNGFDLCLKHEKPWDFFCKSDGMLCCTVCVILDHKNCKSKNVFTIANVAHEMDGNMINHLMHCIDVTIGVTDRLSRVETQLLSDMKRLPKKLKTIRKLTYDTFKESVLTEARMFQDTVAQTVKTKKKECDARINTLRTLLTTMCKVKNSGTPIQQFIVENHLKGETNTLIKLVKREMKTLQRCAATCSFDSHFLNFRNRVNAERKASALNFTYVFAPMPILKLEQVAAKDLTDVKDISKDQISKSELCYAGLDFLSDGRLVLLDKKNGMCLLYNEVLVYLSSKKLPYDHPSGVVVVSDDEVIITTGDNKMLVFVKISKSNEIEITGSCSVKEECTSISVREEGDLLVSLVNSNQPIKLLSKDGGVCADLELPKKACRLTDERNSTFVPDYDKAVWTDISDDALYIYDMVTCTLISVNDKKIIEPCGVAVGPSSHILVCCEKTIVEISLIGQVLSYHKLNMSRPRQICVNKDKSKLAVTSYENGKSKLHLYKIIT